MQQRRADGELVSVLLDGIVPASHRWQDRGL